MYIYGTLLSCSIDELWTCLLFCPLPVFLLWIIWPRITTSKNRHTNRMRSLLTVQLWLSSSSRYDILKIVCRLIRLLYRRASIMTVTAEIVYHKNETQPRAASNLPPAPDRLWSKMHVKEKKEKIREWNRVFHWRNNSSTWKWIHGFCPEFGTQLDE